MWQTDRAAVWERERFALGASNSYFLRYSSKNFQLNMATDHSDRHGED